MRRITDKSIIIDVVITVILTIVVGIGIGIVLSKRPKMYTGELTTDNYADYIDVNCRLSNFQPSSDFTCNYDLVVSPKDDCDIYDLEITVEVSSEGSDFGTYTLKAEHLYAYYTASLRGEVHYSLDFYPSVGWYPKRTVKVIAISGTYKYVNRGQHY